MHTFIVFLPLSYDTSSYSIFALLTTCYGSYFFFFFHILWVIFLIPIYHSISPFYQHQNNIANQNPLKDLILVTLLHAKSIK